MKRILYSLLRNHMVKRMKSIGMTWTTINKVLDTLTRNISAVCALKTGCRK